MSLYGDLARKARKSGEYKARLKPGEEPDTAARGAEGLRLFLRSKMEWIVEREAVDPEPDSHGHGPQEGRQMKLAQSVKFREEKFGGVLFETRSEKVFTLSPTGAAVVREIVAGGDRKTILERLKSRYQDPDGGIEKEATEFIASLEEKGLVTE